MNSSGSITSSSNQDNSNRHNKRSAVDSSQLAQAQIVASGRFAPLGDRILFPSIVQFLDHPSGARFLSCCKRFNAAARTRGDAWPQAWDDKALGDDGARFEWMITKLQPRWSPTHLTIDASNWFTRTSQRARLSLLNASIDDVKLSSLSMFIDPNQSGIASHVDCHRNPVLQFIARVSSSLQRFDVHVVACNYDLTYTQGIEYMLYGSFETRFKGELAPECKWTRLVHLGFNWAISYARSFKWIIQNIPTLVSINCPGNHVDLIPETQIERLECCSLSGCMWEKEDESEYRKSPDHYGLETKARFPRLHTLHLHHALTSFDFDSDRVFLQRVFQAPDVTTLSIAHHDSRNWNLLLHLFPNVRHLALGPDPTHHQDLSLTRRDRGWWAALLEHLPRFKALESFELLDPRLPMTPPELDELLAVLPASVRRLGLDAASAQWLTYTFRHDLRRLAFVTSEIAH